MLGPVDADPERHDAAGLPEVHPVDHQRDQVQPSQVRGQDLAQRRLRLGEEPAGRRRLRGAPGVLLDRLADRLQPQGVAAGGRAPPHPPPPPPPPPPRPGGHPLRRPPRPPSIRSIAIRPSTSVEVNTSYAGTGTSPEPSTARTRGRWTGTRRPPRVTEPRSRPWRTATRPRSWRPLGPHTASTSASIIACITCRPAPTARASRPSRTSTAISPTATCTRSGSAARPGSGVSIRWF